MEKPPPTPPRPVRILEGQLIETEPKTLLHDAMNAARKAALEVICDHSEEEALKIFFKGLQPLKQTDLKFDDLNVTRKKLIKGDKDEDYKRTGV